MRASGPLPRWLVDETGLEIGKIRQGPRESAWRYAVLVEYSM
jgi:hypothetical protein